jgi:hypothetical protein
LIGAPIFAAGYIATVLRRPDVAPPVAQDSDQQVTPVDRTDHVVALGVMIVLAAAVIFWSIQLSV